MKVYILICVVLLASCSESIDRVVNKIFPQELVLAPELYKINEVLKPVDIVVLDDYLIIQNEIIPNADCFFVYTLDSLRFLYSFARNGHGPEEFIAPALVQNDSGNYLSVFDQASFKLIKYEIGKESASLATKCRILTKDKRPWQEIYYRNDSILVFSTLNNRIQTYNMNTKALVDSFSFLSNLKELMEENYNHSFENFHFACYDERLIVGFNFMNKIVGGTIEDNGKIEMEEAEINFEAPLDKSIFNNRYYYMYTTLTSDLAFAQYVGYIFRDLQPFPLNIGRRRFDMLLEVYNSRQDPIAILDLQHNILRCKVDECRRKIYTWNMLEDFDNLMVYDYSMLGDSII